MIYLCPVCHDCIIRLFPNMLAQIADNNCEDAIELISPQGDTIRIVPPDEPFEGPMLDDEMDMSDDDLVYCDSIDKHDCTWEGVYEELIIETGE